MNPSAQTERPASPAPNAKGMWSLLIAGSLFLTALFIWTAWQHFSIRSFSDPYNYLMVARDLVNEFRSSRWPAAYPAYLWLALRVVGPYHVFLANVPLVALLLGLTGTVTALAVRREPGPRVAEAGLIGLGAVSLLIVFDPDVLMILADPYRDPLSHVFLSCAALFLLLFLGTPEARMRWIGVSGLMLGLAASVREPAILFAGPMVLTALMVRRHGGRFPLRPAALWFAAGTAIGLLPILAQMYLATGQVLVPPQAVQEETLFPGFVPARAGTNMRRALTYYALQSKWMAPAAFLTGIGFALARRNRLLLLLFATTALLYAVLYTHYRMFVPRYFFITTLWAAPIAAYGLYHAADSILRLARRSRWRPVAWTGLTCLLMAWAGMRMLELEAPAIRFLPEHARTFKKDIEEHVPPGAFVVSPRNLCEVIGYFTHADSWRAWAMLYPDFRSDAPVYERFRSMLDENRPLYLMELDSPGASNPDMIIFRRYFDLEPIATFDSARYNLQPIAGPGSMTLHHVRPWTSNTAYVALGPVSADSTLQWDVGRLWRDDMPRTFARVYLNNEPLGEVRHNDIQYFRLPETEDAHLELRSDAPVPQSPSPAVLAGHQPIHLDFGLLSASSHDAFLSDSILEEPVHRGYVRIWGGEGRIRLPPLWTPEMRVMGRLAVRATRADEIIPVSLEFHLPDAPAQTVTFHASRRFDLIPILLPGGFKEEQHIGMRIIGEETLELNFLTLFPHVPARAFHIDIGTEEDDPHLLEGFYHRERHHRQIPVRWTSERASLFFHVDQVDIDMIVTLGYVDIPRPADAPPPNLQLHFNGTELDPATYDYDTTKRGVRLKAVVPHEQVRHGENRLDIVVEPWSPLAYGVSRDSRQLGIMLDTVKLQCLRLTP